MRIRIIFNADTFTAHYYPHAKTTEQRDRLFSALYPELEQYCSIVPAISKVLMGVKYRPSKSDRREPFLIGFLDDISTAELYQISDTLETELDRQFRENQVSL